MEKFKQLGRAEMKNVLGGKLQTFACYAVTATGGDGAYVGINADNIDMAQGVADAYAYSDGASSSFPYGINCPGSAD
jgi:hypothetical protein